MEMKKIELQRLQREIDELKKSPYTYLKIIISQEVIREINAVKMRFEKIKSEDHEIILKEIPEIQVMWVTKNLDLMLYAMNSKTIDAEVCKNLNELQHLIYGITLGMYEIAYPHLTKKNQVELKNLRTNLQKKIIKLSGKMEGYEKALEDKQEKVKKMIENMAVSYIETCEKFKTHKPRNWMLEKISGVDERTWKTQKNNEIFMKQLLGELKKKFGNAKKQRPFWQQAINFVNTKIDFISIPDHFKLKYGLDEKSDSAKRTGSKTDKVKAKEIQQEQNDEDRSELQCIICGEAIESGELCEDCLEEFPINK